MNTPYKIKPLIAALLLTQVTGAFAQDLEEEDLALVYGDKHTVSIATGTKQSLRRAPSVATVITAEDIAAMGATELNEVLETVPGMHVSNFGSRNMANYQIRGIAGSTINPQVLILQNGISVNTLYRGDKGETWGSQPLENIARIEIIRGPGSALYGADAFSGVINIITKTAADAPGTEFGVRAGSFNSRDGWVQHGGKLGPVDVAAYVHVGSTDGFREIVPVDAQSARDKSFGTQVSLAPGAVNTGYDAVDANVDFGYDKWRLRAGYKLRDNLGTGVGVSSALDPVGQNRGERVNADLSWNDTQFSENWGLGFNASVLQFTEDEYLQLSPPGSSFDGKNLVSSISGKIIANPSLCGRTSTGLISCFPLGMIGNPERSERQLRISGNASYTGFAGHNLRLGLGHEDLNMYEVNTHKNYLLNASGPPTPTAFIDYSAIQPHTLPQRRKVDYLYLQDEWNLAQDWTLTWGVRHDRYSDFGGTTNPRLALVWDAALDLTAKLLYGQAFRAPTFSEQYGVNPVSNGNPKLKPESIHTLEAAFSWQARQDTQVNLSVFRYEAEDLIRTKTNIDPLTGATVAGATFQNTGKQHGSGVEIEAIWDANRSLRLTGNYSYQDSIDDASGKDAGFVPHHHLYLRGDWRFTGGWLASTQVNRVADRRRAVGDTRPQVPDYTTVDLTVRTVQKQNQWGFAASLRNLFNADVTEPSANANIPNDYPMAPRSFWLQATYKL
ncbi:MAG: TonB-dependent receptor [Sulfuricella sp.]|nr:TonB-dependent receptor [Sulfuricella sp.]